MLMGFAHSLPDHRRKLGMVSQTGSGFGIWHRQRRWKAGLWAVRLSLFTHAAPPRAHRSSSSSSPSLYCLIPAPLGLQSTLCPCRGQSRVYEVHAASRCAPTTVQQQSSTDSKVQGPDDMSQPWPPRRTRLTAASRVGTSRDGQWVRDRVTKPAAEGVAETAWLPAHAMPCCAQPAGHPSVRAP